MPLEIAALAASVVGSFLLPLAKQGVEKLGEAVSAKFSAAAGEHVSKIAQNIWEKVKGAFSSDEEKTTLTQFEERPEENILRVERILKEKMEADPKLATEIDELAKSPTPGDGGTAVSIAATTVGYVDARHATISGGIVAGIVQGTPPTIPPPNK